MKWSLCIASYSCCKVCQHSLLDAEVDKALSLLLRMLVQWYVFLEVDVIKNIGTSWNTISSCWRGTLGCVVEYRMACSEHSQLPLECRRKVIAAPSTHNASVSCSIYVGRGCWRHNAWVYLILKATSYPSLDTHTSDSGCYVICDTTIRERWPAKKRADHTRKARSTYPASLQSCSEGLKSEILPLKKPTSFLHVPLDQVRKQSSGILRYLSNVLRFAHLASTSVWRFFSSCFDILKRECHKI